MSNHDISQFEYMEKTGNSGYIVVINGEKKYTTVVTQITLLK